MDRKLLEYLPPVLREVMEMQAINGANEPEIALAWDTLTQVLANQFLETADENGVTVWEKELSILSKDTDTLELRKARIKATWNQEIPYSFPWLRRWLDGLYGQENHSESIEDYTIHIQVDHTGIPESSGLMTEILRMLATVLPSNMRLLLEGIIKKSFAEIYLAPALGGWYSATRLPVLPLPYKESVALCLTPAMGGSFSVTRLPEA